MCQYWYTIQNSCFLVLNAYHSNQIFRFFGIEFMATWHNVAELLFPGVDPDIQKLLDKYPERNCVCVRIAPSPT